MLQPLQMFQTVGLNVLIGLALVLATIVLRKEKIQAAQYWAWRINLEGCMFCLSFLLLLTSAAGATGPLGAVLLNLSATILLPLAMLHEMRRLSGRSKAAKLLVVPVRSSPRR